MRSGSRALPHSSVWLCALFLDLAWSLYVGVPGLPGTNSIVLNHDTLINIITTMIHMSIYERYISK
jgi:hypothetical protein